MVGNRKRKRVPTPSSESFGDLEYFEEEYFGSDGGTSLTPLHSPSSPSSKNTDNSMDLTPSERAFIKAMERLGLAGSN
jgi:hypothetical protein